MALTLSKVAARTWRELGWSIDLKVTGAGSQTTIVSSQSPYTSDNSMVKGTAVVIYDAGGAGATPEGELSRITGYTASTTTFTVDSMTAATAAGDKVLIANPRVQMEQMIQAVNDGLSALGTISLVDTSLTSGSDQTEYALPVGLKIRRLLDVQYQTVTDDSNDNRYMSIMGQTDYVPSAPGSTGLLLLPQLPASRTIKIIYEGVHPTLTAYNSVISETIQEELAVAAAIDKALTWYVSKRGDSVLGTFITQRWNDAKNMLQAQKAEKPIYRIKPKAKWFVA